MYVRDIMYVLEEIPKRIKLTEATNPVFVAKGTWGCILISVNNKLYEYILDQKDLSKTLDEFIHDLVSTFKEGDLV